VTLEGPRLLDKCFAGAVITTAGDPPSTGADIVGSGWGKLSDTSYVSRSYYDLSGYTTDDLTAFWSGVEIQEEFQPHGDLTGYVVDLVTTESLTSAQITGAHFDDPAAVLDLPGFPRSTFDQNQVIYGRTRTFNASTTEADPTNNITEFGRTRWGTCSAATSEKIFLTRIVYVNFLLPAAGQKINIPPANYVTAAIIAKEPELSFLMRQKRSYEIATS